jgi:tripartite-type tricarboxylate transporter receptor subunit TctC
MPHNITRRSLMTLAALSPFADMHAAHAQTTASGFPSSPITVVVPAAAGGGTDILARAFAAAAAKHLPVPMVVADKGGGSGSVGMQDVANSKPDGYRLSMVIVELTIIPHLGVGKVTSDDFAPIAMLNADPAAITVRADAPWNTIEEFLAAARKEPGKITVGDSGVGSIWQLSAASLAEKAGVKFTQVPFQGAAPAVLALMGGQIDSVAVSPAEVTNYLRDGKLKMLAVMADQRVPEFKDAPTLKERGIDVSIGAWRGLAAPKGTPPEIITYLEKMARDTTNEPSFQKALADQNLGFSFSGAADFKATMAKQNAYFKALVAKLGLKAN